MRGGPVHLQTPEPDWIELGTQDGAGGDNFDPRGLGIIRGNDVFITGNGFDSS